MGHMDFRPATFTGNLLSWEGKDAFDSDYNLAFKPTNGEAVTTFREAEAATILLEFDGDEFPDSRDDWPGPQSTFWRSVQQGADNGVARTTAQLLVGGGNDAVVVGMLGNDCTHTCSVELHPVYVLAIRTTAGLDPDTWAFFARNWGDEGACYSHDVPLWGSNPDDELTDFSVTLPPPIDTPLEVTTIDQSDVHRGARNLPADGSLPSVTVAGDVGSARLIFHMLPEANKSIVEGTVTLSWKAPHPAAPGTGCSVGGDP